MLNKIFKILTQLILILMIISAAAYAGGKHIDAAEKILKGVKVRGTDIGGLTADEAVNKLAVLEKQMLSIPVAINYQGQNHALSLEDVGFAIDKQQTVSRALQINKTGSFIERWRKRRIIAESGLQLPPVLTINEEKLAEEVNLFAEDVNNPPQDATISVDEHDQVVITPSKNGRKPDIERLAQGLLQELLVSDQVILTLPVVDVKPNYTTEEIQGMGINGLLSSYSTRFDPQMTNRSYNIRVAANALDGLLVTPGEEVSFNEVVGPRSSEAGYKTAGVIIDNELVEGLGGGVCQVSSTLYNAVLLAGIEIVERSNHSLPVSYVPIGRDATVVYGVVDFKFQNNTGRCLYLKTMVNNGELTIKIFGDTSRKYKVVIESSVDQVIEPKVIYQQDENLKVGQQVVKQEGSKGYVASLKRLIIKDGVIIREDKLPQSRYNAVNKIIAVGTAQSKPVIMPPKADVLDNLPSAEKPALNKQDNEGVQENASVDGPTEQKQHGQLEQTDTGTPEERNKEQIGQKEEPVVN